MVAPQVVLRLLVVWCGGVPVAGWAVRAAMWQSHRAGAALRLLPPTRAAAAGHLRYYRQQAERMRQN